MDRPETLGRRFGRRLSANLSDRLQRTARSVFRPALTVSREEGARALPVCALLADYLTIEDETADFGWTVLDKDLLAQVINSRWLSDPGGEPGSARVTGSFELTATTIRQLAQIGNMIIVGLCGICFTEGMENVFHLRLIGSEQSRLEHIQGAHNLGTEEAIAHLRRADRERHDFAMSYFHRDISDPTAYDAVIKTDGLPDETLAQMIGDLFMGWATAKAQDWRKIVPIS